MYNKYTTIKSTRPWADPSIPTIRTCHLKRTPARSCRRANARCYLAFALVFVIGFSPFLGLLVLYLARGEYRSTWLESHCDWLIATFWLAFKVAIAISIAAFVLGGVIGSAAVWLIYLGYALLGLWFAWRLWYGWQCFEDNEPVADPEVRG